MDPRIGMLMVNGALVYYAFVNGYHNPEVQGTQAEVEAALGLRAPVEPMVIPKRKPLHNYAVLVDLKYAPINTHAAEIEVAAANARDACRKAREQMIDQGHTRWDGPLILKARKV